MIQEMNKKPLRCGGYIKGLRPEFRRWLQHEDREADASLSYVAGALPRRFREGKCDILYKETT
jgi:hypothetical protein